jgi:histidinol-phosphate aminotransferase
MPWSELIRPELEPLIAYAPGLRVSQVRERAGMDDVRKLSSNEHPAGPFPRALAAMAKVLPHLNRYPDGGAIALKDRLSEHLGVARERIVVTNGSNELLCLLGQATVRPGDEIVFGWPSFVVYPMVAAMFAAKEVRVPLTSDDAYDLDAILEAITERTRIVFLCNPNNPTGNIYRRDAFERFLDRVPGHVLVVVDEAYFEFVDDADYPDTLHYFDGERPLAVCRTFSKMYSLAGARIGYGVMPEPLARAVDKVREPFNVNTVAQVGAYYSLADTDEVAARKADNLAQKARIYAVLDRLAIAYTPSHTNFIYVKTDRPTESFQALLEQGVIARDFGAAPALRFSIGNDDDTDRTIAAIERIVADSGTF